MSHIALYRKKRPLTFEDVVGQQHIIKALTNQVATNQVSHAYLFCGTRGTGKTSIARILARAVNCQTPHNGSPCNTCEGCQSILAERNLNVVEIDAASNNGVENIRDLRDEVKYQPTQGKYKVYIVDEVHMLSASAFNALLKTLEEPPPYVMFILATTDLQKLPATILSRCQRYDFRRIGAADMVATLKKYLEEAGVEYEAPALDYIAYHSDGAMRDALSLLDQSLSLEGNKLTYHQVLEMLGAVDKSQLFQFTDALAACDSGKVMEVIRQAMDNGRDASQFVADLIRHFRDVLVASLVTDPHALDFSGEIATTLREQGGRVPSHMLMEYIHVFSETLRDMRFAPHARTAFEVCALKLCAPRVVVETPVLQAAPAQAPPTQAPVQTAAPTPPPTASAPTGDITPQVLDDIANSWDALCQTFPNPMRSQCAQCGMEHNDGKLELVTGSETIKNILKPKEGAIREAIAHKFNLTTPPNLAFIARDGYTKKATTQPGTFTPIAPATSATAITPEPEPQLAQQTIAFGEISPFEAPPQPPPEDIPPFEDGDSIPPIPDPDGWDDIGTEVTDQDTWEDVN